LALETAQDELITIGVRLHLRPHTALVGGYRGRETAGVFRAPLQLNDRVVTVRAEELVAEPARAAIELALTIFHRFGWLTTTQQLQVLQRELYQPPY